MKSVRPSGRSVVELAACTLLLLLPLVFNPYSPQSFEPPKVLFFRVVVVVMAVGFLTARRFTVVLSALDVSVLLYLGAHLAATLTSIDPMRSFWGGGDGHGTLTLVGCAACFFMISRTFRPGGDGSSLVTAALVGSVPVALYGIVQFFGWDPLIWETDAVSPALSSIGRSNYLGAYMAMLVPLGLARLRSSSGAQRWRLGIVLTLQILSVLLSQARAAWLAMTAGATVFAALSLGRGRRSARRYIALAILLSGLLLFVPLSLVDLSSPAADGGFPEARAATVRSRVAIWSCTVPLVGKRWPLGYGPESFASVFEESCDVAPPGWIVDDPHNLFLSELIDAGVTGAGAFALVLVALFRAAVVAARSTSRHARGVVAALAGSAAAYVVQAQFNPDVIVITVLFYAIVALIRAPVYNGDVLKNEIRA